MTLLMFDGGCGPLPPYLDWLGDPTDSVLFTGRSRAEVASCDTDNYAEVRCFERYHTSSEVELAAIRLAHAGPIRAIVALAPEDAIRAGALRDHLDLPGQGRREAIVERDLQALRACLSGAGLPTLDVGVVQRLSDLYWYGHRWGYPLRVRHRRRTAWPTVVTLHGEADVAAFTRGGLTSRLETMPSLLVEPARDDHRDRIVVLCPLERSGVMPAPNPRVAAALAHAALARVTRPGESAWRVELVRCGSERDWRVDGIVRDAGDQAALARAQAGLARRVGDVIA
jgi:hypothetical protein